MLVLTRKVNEAIVIAGDIEVRVIGIQNGKVQLGVTAPRSVPVHRHEIQERISFEQMVGSPGGPAIAVGAIAG